MKKFTGNYSNTEHNFVIQNLPPKVAVSESELQVIFVLKNILLRGSPTVMSKNLQEEFEIPAYTENKDFTTQVSLISPERQNWFSIIGGDIKNQYFPAKEFYNSLPTLLPKFEFIQNLIRPETPIVEIIEEGANDFIEQRVDFYLEAAKLVIEIDGGQHIRNAMLDRKRNELFLANNIATVRITTNDFRDKTTVFSQALQQIERYLSQFEKSLVFYSRKQYTAKEISTKLIPTAALRWQILLLSLLENGAISLSDKSWKINIINSDVSGFALKSTNDLLIWILNLFKLNNREFIKPIVRISESKLFDNGSINVDFSLLKRWTDENKNSPTTIFVRTDYFQSKNYFEISAEKPVTYNIKKETHQATLEFFLQNIFDMSNFKDGQLSIICYTLNRKDTLGLLPTGGGKSICYQLSSILQPGVSFIVSPLKSLMIDQKENLNRAFITRTAYIVSGNQNAIEKDRVQKDFQNGKFHFVWISPERLQIKKFREYLGTVNSKYKIVYAVIDEVHCLSEWGHDFRTSYLNLAKTIKNYCSDAKYLGLTATASPRVHKDIKVEFKIDDENIVFPKSFDREELTFIIRKCASNEKMNYTKEIIKEFQKETNFINREGEEGKAGILFAPHVNWEFGCYGIYKALDRIYPKKIDFYSGEVPKVNVNGVKQPIMPENEYEEYKMKVQKNFSENKFPILTSTKAFGMGIDKPNINLTIHFGISPSIEAIYQEAGRAGRHPDKKEKAKSKCYILFSDEVNMEIKDSIESPNTTFDQLFKIQDDFKFRGDDMFRQLFFYTESFVGQDKELNEIINFTKEYFQPNQTRTILYNGKRDKTRKEKSIYRLSLLNVVYDYTVDFLSGSFEVSFQQKTDESVFSGLHTYIVKYEPIALDDLRKKVNELSDTTMTARCLRYLIQWIYKNVAAHRRQAIKDIAGLCREYNSSDESKSSEEFKRGIISYFEINEVTFLLQYLSENPRDYTKWFEPFVKRNKDKEIIEQVLVNQAATRDLRQKLQRFLESYNNNIAFNFISGIVRLFLNEFDDQDGGTRFAMALGNMKNIFQNVELEEIADKTLELGILLEPVGKFNLSVSFLKAFPGFSQKFYDVLGDANSLDFILQLQTDRLQKINSKLYGKLTGIE